MFHVKTASVRELRQDFARIHAWLRAGEEIAITMRRQPIATLIPCVQKRRPKRPMPDLTARLRKVFGDQVLPDKVVKSILDHDRGAI